MAAAVSMSKTTQNEKACKRLQELIYTIFNVDKICHPPAASNVDEAINASAIVATETLKEFLGPGRILMTDETKFRIVGRSHSLIRREPPVACKALSSVVKYPTVSADGMSLELYSPRTIIVSAKYENDRVYFRQRS